MRSTMLYVLALATLGACGVDEPPGEDAPWPCGSWTEANGEASFTSYRWDSRHNLVRQEGPGKQLDTWTYDPYGRIAIGETHVSFSGTDRTTVLREVVDGQVMSELYTSDSPGLHDELRVNFIYRNGRLVEKRSTFGVTTVEYPVPDRRVEVLRRASDGHETRTTWIGEPWTRMIVEEPEDTLSYDTIRVLDDEGRLLHSESVWHEDPTPHRVVDIERGPNGAPLTETRDGYLTTYTTECTQ